MERFNLYQMCPRSLKPITHVPIGVAIAAASLFICGCRTSGLSLQVDEIDIFHEESMPTKTNVVNAIQNEGTSFLAK